MDSPRNGVLLVLAIFFLGPVLLAGALVLPILSLVAVDVDQDSMRSLGVLSVISTMLIGAVVLLVATAKQLQEWRAWRASKGR